MYEQLNLLGVKVQLTRLVDFDLAHTFSQSWDMVILHRVAYDSYVEGLVSRARRGGAVILFDCDDLVFELDAFQHIGYEDFSDPVRARLYRASMMNFRRTLETADGVITSTDYLAAQVALLGKPAWVHRNAFSLEMLACAEQAYQQRQLNLRQLVIGYASGTATHNRDFEQTRQALKKILLTNPQAELWLVGPLNPGSDWGKLTSRIRHFGLVPWRELPRLLVQFDINLAPLVTSNPFSQSKSEIKFMEAAMVRVPTVASPTEAFSYAIHSGETGFLVNGEDEWEAALARLVGDPELSVQIGAQAYSDVIARYHPVARATELAPTLNQASQSLKGRALWDEVPSQEQVSRKEFEAASNPFFIPLSLAKDPTNFRLGIYSLLHSGPRLLMNQMWVIFRRFIAPIFPFRNQTK